jgi:uncharacterized protein YsxB (DUF464 family)
MVEVSWRKDSTGHIWSLECSGHAGFDEELDLVCAAVSALTGALGLGFSRVLSLPAALEAADGSFRLRLMPAQALHPEFPAAQVLLRTTVLALSEMIQHYPGFIQRKPGEEDHYD